MPKQSKSLRLLEEPVGSTLLRLTIPMVFGIVSIMFINLIDTFYIGQLGVRELAAISFTFPVVFIVMSFAFGIGIGTSVVVSRAIGQEDREQASRLTTDSLYLTVGVMVLVSGLGLGTIEPVFTIMGASGDLLPIIRDYMVPWYFGVGLVAVPIVGNNAIRATGDSKTPSIVMIATAIVNAVLDPFLIFGIGPFPKMGVQGAAVATVIAYVCSFLAGLWVLGKREQMLEGGFPRLRTARVSWKRILYIGAPAAITNMLTPISAAVLTRLVSTYGLDAVAAFGVGTRLESLAMLGVMAFAAILTPFIGQNLGAQNYDRIYESVRYGSRFSMIWGVAACALLALAAHPIALVFNDTESVQSMIRLFLWIVPLSFGFYGMTMLAGSACNGLNRPLQSAAINFVRLFVLVVPLAWWGSRSWGLLGLFVGISAGNILSGAVSIIWLRARLLSRILTIN